MQIHDLQPLNPPKKRKRIGRGGKKGNYSGRGSKGQKSRAGARIRPQLREIMNKFPKNRGEGFRTVKPNISTISLEDLQKNFPQGGNITPLLIVKKGLVERHPHEKLRIKILAKGKIETKFNIQNCLLSKKANDLILKNGGTVIFNKEK
ncbi:MAG: uL15 family ribosomal protein [Minisyncoccia bacterium]